MRLIECYIENFGRLSAFSYVFKPGMNILCQENGWGKTTFAAFIKAMLYGLGSSRSQSLAQNERQRFLPWQGGICGGSLTFETEDGARYRVERTFGTKEAQDTFRLFDGVTGLVSNAYTENLGEELFGIDAAGYERSTYISEKLTSDGVKDYSGIQAKLVDMQDLSDYEVACAKLEKRRKYYRIQGGKGAIYDVEQKLARLRGELTECEDALARTSALNRESREYETAREAKEAELRALRREVEASIAARSSRALSAHAADLTARYREAHEHTASCLAYLSGNPPTLQEVDERIRVCRRLRESKKPELPSVGLPTLLPPLMVIAGILLIPAGIILGAKATFFYFLGPILGALLAGAGIVLSFARRKQLETLAAAQANRAEYDRLSADLAAFLARYPVARGDLTLTDDEKRLWAIREKVEEYRMALHDEEQAQSQLESFRATHPAAFEAERPLTDEEQAGGEKERELTREIDTLREEQNRCQREVARYAASAGRYTACAQEIASLEAQAAAYRKSLEIVQTTAQYLAAAHSGLTSRYLGTIQGRFRHYLQLLTDAETDTPVSDEYVADSYTVTPDFAVQVSRCGQTKSAEALSRGGRDLVALCLRFAISDALFSGKHPFLILDDPFINLDDEKVRSAMELLHRIAEERQILYVCCHSSRA